MAWIKASTFHSFAKYFCIFACVSAIVIAPAQSAWGACDNEDQDILRQCNTSADFKKNNYELCRRVKDACASTASSADPCLGAREHSRTSYRDFKRQCGDAGLGSSCESTIGACEGVAGDKDYPTDNEFFKALGQKFGVSNASGKCPKYSGQGYFERKDKYEKSLDDVNDKLSDIKEKTAELNDKFTKDMQEVQEDLQKQQEDLKKKQLDINKAQRERAAEILKATSEVAATIRKKQSEILQLRTQIAETYRSKNSTLIAMSENASKRACMKKVNELKKEYSSVKAGSVSNGLITAASKKKKELNDTFNECMSQFDVQRAALISQTQEKVDAIEMQVANNQSDMDNAEQQLASMTAQEQQAKADEATEMTNATNAVAEKITRGQAKLQSLAQTTQQKAKALEEKQTYYQKKSNQVSNALNTLGPAPEDETSTTKLSQVQAAYDTYTEAICATSENESNTTTPNKGRSNSGKR